MHLNLKSEANRQRYFSGLLTTWHKPMRPWLRHFCSLTSFLTDLQGETFVLAPGYWGIYHAKSHLHVLPTTHGFIATSLGPQTR